MSAILFPTIGSAECRRYIAQGRAARNDVSAQILCAAARHRASGSIGYPCREDSRRRDAFPSQAEPTAQMKANEPGPVACESNGRISFHDAGSLAGGRSAGDRRATEPKAEAEAGVVAFNFKTEGDYRPAA